MASANRSYTVREAARVMKVTTKYVYDLVYGGQLEAEKLDRQWRIPAAAVQARLKQRGE